MATTLLLLAPVLWVVLRSADAFAPASQFRQNSRLSQQQPDDQEADDGLILSGEAVAKEMTSLRSKYPTTESDYLAAARARSAAKTESVDCAASDEDWNSIKAAQQKATGKEINAWDDPSAGDSEEGAEGNVLIPDVDDEGDEPKLMLF